MIDEQCTENELCTWILKNERVDVFNMNEIPSDFLHHSTSDTGSCTCIVPKSDKRTNGISILEVNSRVSVYFQKHFQIQFLFSTSSNLTCIPFSSLG